jgi:HD superfamily phosphodiesterase
MRGSKMTIAEIIVKMIEYSKGNLHDINHFMKVYAYAKTIGECENLSPFEQKILEVAAIVHDIACPLCREKYGNTNGSYQEKEGVILTREFLRETNLPEEAVERIVFLVAHHHTLSNISGQDYQILIEADYLVNADESNYSESNIQNTKERIFKTATGTALLKSVYGI